MFDVLTFCFDLNLVVKWKCVYKGCIYFLYMVTFSFPHNFLAEESYHMTEMKGDAYNKYFFIDNYYYLIMEQFIFSSILFDQ